VDAPPKSYSSKVGGSAVDFFAGEERGEEAAGGGEGEVIQDDLSEGQDEVGRGGGSAYAAEQYKGGVSILEPDVLFQDDAPKFLDGDSKWRCWPSGPLPPNTKILGTDANMLTVAPQPLVDPTP
jgi:hypothetical protein